MRLIYKDDCKPCEILKYVIHMAGVENVTLVDINSLSDDEKKELSVVPTLYHNGERADGLIQCLKVIVG